MGRMSRSTPKRTSRRKPTRESWRRCSGHDAPGGREATETAARGVPGFLVWALSTSLLCGIGTNLHNLVTDWDELFGYADADFPGSGLHPPSVIIIASFLHVPAL